MNKLTYSALAISMAAGSAMGATSIKSVEDLANNIVTNRANLLPSLEIGTIFNGQSVNGNTALSSDDLSGNGPAPGSWSGGDDVYSLQWGGGDITIDLLFSQVSGDLDLWLVGDPNVVAPAIDSSLSVSDNEQVSAIGLAAGKYWIIIDGWQGASNTYKLAVSPTPGAAAVFGLAGLAAAGRRRR